MTALGPGLISGKFKVTKSKHMTGIHGKFAKTPECASGTFTVTGSFKISQTTFGHGIHQWELGSGHNASGGSRPSPIQLTIGGHKEPDATITMVFAGSGQQSAGEINWGVGQIPGFQPCTIEYRVAPS
jgi:hypothetical protein